MKQTEDFKAVLKENVLFLTLVPSSDKGYFHIQGYSHLFLDANQDHNQVVTISKRQHVWG